MALIELVNLQDGNKCRQNYVTSEELLQWGDNNNFASKQWGTIYCTQKVEHQRFLDLNILRVTTKERLRTIGAL